MVPVGARLTDWWPLSPLGIFFHKTRSSSEDWVPWTDGDSDLLTLPTIRFLALLKTCWLLFGNQPSVIQLWSVFIGWTWPWSLSFLKGSALSRFLYLGLCFSQQSIIYRQLHCNTGFRLRGKYIGTYKTGTWFLLVLDSLTDDLSVLLESSSIQLGLPQKIGVIEQMATLIFLPYLQSAF